MSSFHLQNCWISCRSAHIGWHCRVIRSRITPREYGIQLSFGVFFQPRFICYCYYLLYLKTVHPGSSLFLSSSAALCPVFWPESSLRHCCCVLVVLTTSAFHHGSLSCLESVPFLLGRCFSFFQGCLEFGKRYHTVGALACWTYQRSWTEDCFVLSWLQVFDLWGMERKSCITLMTIFRNRVWLRSRFTKLTAAKIGTFISLTLT